MYPKEIEKLLLKVQKPGRYVGGEPGSVVKNKEEVNVRFAFCFPDTYEIGMSHIGIKILYAIFNNQPDIWCERVFAPWEDMEGLMRENNIPLYGLESGEPIVDFDFVGFTLQYELSYTNMLNMLDLAGIPMLSKERGEDYSYPIVVCGGPCAVNPEPLADFVDIFFIGEGEEVDLEVMELYKKCRSENIGKKEFLRLASQIQGVYVPALYSVEYNADGTVAKVTANDGAPENVVKRIVKDINKAYYPESFIVPMVEIVHDRAVAEIFRGCIRGCRFCQAGFIYRPVREKSVDVIDKQCHLLCQNTGYDELSLSSLSTSDYSDLDGLLDRLLTWTDPARVSISLPSQRVDSFSTELMEKIKTVRKSGLTFAPEAGTQRLRDAINKNVTEEELLKTCNTAFSGGWTSIKLYFMIGLPTETMEDVAGIAQLSQKVVNAYYSNPNKQKGKSVKITSSASCFVPKPFTPFQWEAQDTVEMLKEKQQHLCDSVTTKKVVVNWHDAETSFMEGVFARGDRRTGKVIYEAWKNGCKFDGWTGWFKYDQWMKAFETCGVDPLFYTSRKRSTDEVLPWDHIDVGISKEFLKRELEKAYASETTVHCREKCSGCGANKLNGGKCDARNSGCIL